MPQRPDVLAEVDAILAEQAGGAQPAAGRGVLDAVDAILAEQAAAALPPRDPRLSLPSPLDAPRLDLSNLPSALPVGAPQGPDLPLRDALLATPFTHAAAPPIPQKLPLKGSFLPNQLPGQLRPSLPPRPADPELGFAGRMIERSQAQAPQSLTEAVGEGLRRGVMGGLTVLPAAAEAATGAFRAIPTAIGESAFDQSLPGHEDEQGFFDRLKSHAAMVLSGEGGSVLPIGPVKAATNPVTPADIHAQSPIALPPGVERASAFVAELSRRGLDMVAQLATDPSMAAAGGLEGTGAKLLAFSFGAQGIDTAVRAATNPNATPEDVAEAVIGAGLMIAPAVFQIPQVRAGLSHLAADARAARASREHVAREQQAGRIPPEPTDIPTTARLEPAGLLPELSDNSNRIPYEPVPEPQTPLQSPQPTPEGVAEPAMAGGGWDTYTGRTDSPEMLALLDQVRRAANQEPQAPGTVLPFAARVQAEVGLTPRDEQAARPAPAVLADVDAILAQHPETAPAADAPASTAPPTPDTTPAPPSSTAPGVSPNDIPLDIAERAHNGTSWVPEQRAHGEQRQYVAHMEHVWGDLSARATTPEQQALAQTEFARYRAAYVQKNRELLGRRGRMVSSAIAGPSKFPARQQEKIHDAYGKALNEFVAWDTRARKAMVEAVDPTAPRAISSDREDAVTALQAKIDVERKTVESMRAVNQIVRKKALTPQQKVAEIVALTGWKEGTAHKILEPDFANRIGFPDFEFQNRNANIRRMEARIAEIGQNRSAPAGGATFDGGRIDENVEANRIQVSFDAKPDEAMRAQLKANGFKWAPSLGVWQRQRNENARAATERLFGVTLAKEPPPAPVPEPPAPHPVIADVDAILKAHDADRLDTGEEQRRLPGETGAVRDIERETPQFEAPFSLTPEAEQRDSVQSSLFGGSEPPASTPPPRATTGDIETIADPSPIRLDPKTYQFKASDASGVTGALKGVDEWDPLSPPIVVHERADGSRYVADGHQRLNKYRELQAAGADLPPLRARVVRESEGVSVADVRRAASLRNVQEGSASPVDVAKLLREGPLTDSEKRRIPKTALAGARLRQGEQLATLGDRAFEAVVNGDVDPAYAAFVGAHLTDPAEQLAAVRALADAHLENAFQAEQFVKALKSDEFSTAVQTDLFGEQTVATSLAKEKAQVLDAVSRALRTQKSTFANLVRNQARVEGAGNTLARDTNAKMAAEAGRLQTLLDTFAHQAGHTQEALRAAAKRVAAGDVRPADAIEPVLTALERDFRGDTGQSDRPVADGRLDRGSGRDGSRPSPTPAKAVTRPSSSTASEPLPPRAARPSRPSPIPPVRETAASPTRRPFLDPPADTPGAPRIAPLKPSAIVKAIGRLFDVPIKTGRFRQRAHGIYKIEPRVVRLKVENDLATLAHELGHHIDYALLERVPVDLFADEILKLGAATSRPSYTKDQKLAEGVAEFFRLYLGDPAAARREAPIYSRALAHALETQPALAEQLARAQAIVQAYLAQPLEARGRAHIDFGQTRFQRALQAVADIAADPKTFLVKLETLAVDDLAAVRRAVDDLADGQPVDFKANAYVLARLARGAAGKAHGFLEFGIRNREGQKVAASFSDALAPVRDRLEDFGAYLVARHVPERLDAGKETGITRAEAAAIVQDLDSPEFQKAADAVYAFKGALLDYAVEGGVLPAKARAAFAERYQAHVPLFRVDRPAGGGGRRLANRPSPFKRAKGSGADIINPLEGIIRQVYQVVQAVEQRRALDALVQQATTTVGGGKYLEEVPRTMVPVRLGTPEVLDKLWHEKGLVLSAEDDGAEPIALGPEGDTLTFWMPAPFEVGGKGYIVLPDRDGRPHVYSVNDPALYDAISFVGPQPVHLALKILGAPARVLRAGATLTLGFVVRNPVRDTFMAGVQSGAGFKPGLDTVRGLFRYLRHDELYEQFLHSGAAGAALVSGDRNVLQRELRGLGEKTWRETLTNAAFHWIDTLRAISEAGEVATRLGDFSRTLKKEGVSEEGLARAALGARDVTLDFAKAGTWGRQWNGVVAFFNAGVQGYARLYETFKTDPFGTTLRALAYITALSAALWYLNHDDEEYQKLPPWERQLFWHVPLRLFGGTGFLKAPKPFELGLVFGTSTEAALDYLATHDATAVRRLFTDDTDADAGDIAGDTAKRAAERLVAQLVPTAILPMIEARFNYSSWRDRAIVSPWDTELDPPLQYNRWTSATAKRLGKLLNYSPAKIDYLIYGYGAGLARGVVQGGEAAAGALGAPIDRKPASGVSGLPGLGAFVRPLATADAEPLERFYRELTALESAKRSVKRYDEAGDRAAGDAIRQKYPDGPQRLARLRSAKKGLEQARDAVDEVFASRTLDPDQKRELLDRAYERMINVASAALGEKPVRRFTSPVPPALIETLQRGQRPAPIPTARP